MTCDDCHGTRMIITNPDWPNGNGLPHHDLCSTCSGTGDSPEGAEAMISTPEGLIPADVDLVGIDGNAFAIIGTVAQALRDAGNDQFIVRAFQDEAFSGDYDHVLQTALAYTEAQR